MTASPGGPTDATPRDRAVPTGADALSARRAALLELWGTVLTGPSGAAPTDAVVAELSEYFKMPETEVRRRCDNSNQLSRAEWLERDRDTPDDLVEFWNRASPVFGITMSHAKQFHGLHPSSSVELALGLADLCPGTMLDFGVGPGTNAMFFTTLGWKVAMSDISTVMLDFARWRAERRGIEASYFDTRTQPLPSGAFDLVMALEVMHVVPDVAAVLRQIRGAMRIGGTLVFNVYAPPRGPETYSYLYEASWPVMRQVRRAGFKRHRRVAHFYRYEKVERGRWATNAVAVADIVRYNRYVTLVGNTVRRWSAHRG